MGEWETRRAWGRLGIGFGSVALVATLAGCAPTVIPTPAPGPSITPPNASASPQTHPSGVRFGKAHRWPDGLMITIGKPRPFWPSGWVRTVNSFSHYVELKVTIRNGATTRFDVTRLQITARSGGRDADGVHDPGKLGGSPPSSVAKGRTASYRIAFGVRKPADVTVTIVARPGLEPVRVTH
ncbi:MAG: hypothetical protein QM695_04340 [Micropruina sp.]